MYMRTGTYRIWIYGYMDILIYGYMGIWIYGYISSNLSAVYQSIVVAKMFAAPPPQPSGRCQ